MTLWLGTLAVALAVASTLVARPAKAQPSGDMDTPEGNRLALRVTEGKALSLEPRFVPTGMYYVVLPVTVANPGGASGDRAFLRSSAFRLMTHQGASYTPTDDTAPLRGGAAVANRCGLIYLVGNRPASCALVFLVPTSVNRGFLEFVPSPHDVVSVPVTIRE
jgi:hypothetical protein